MLSRIKRLMDEKGLSISSFADEVGVKRPAMTHTLTGRNNPSLDIVTKILETYSDISPDWLMFGKGPMKKGNTPIQQGLFEELDEEKESTSAVPAESISKSLNQPKEINPIVTEIAPIAIKNSLPDKRIAKIMVFYSDNTFETFVQEDISKR